MYGLFEVVFNLFCWYLVESFLIFVHYDYKSEFAFHVASDFDIKEMLTL